MRKAWVGIVATIAVLSAAGIGFAAFTSSVYVNATASTANLALLWVAPATSIPLFHPPLAPATCAANLASPSAGPSPWQYSSTTITFAVSGLAVGDFCGLGTGDTSGVSVINLGGLAATLSESATCAVNGGAPAAATVGPGVFGPSTWICGFFQFEDAVFYSISSPLAPGVVAPYFADIFLPAGTNVGTQPQFVAFAITLTGTA